MAIRTYLAPILFATIPAVAIVACGGGLAGLCSDVCNCQTCSDTELEECEAEAEKAEEQAANSGCEDQLDAFVACQEAAFKCNNERAEFTDPCSDEIKSLTKCDEDIKFLGAGNPCDRAAEVCGVSDGEGEGECTGTAECFSKCIVEANRCDAEVTTICASDCV